MVSGWGVRLVLRPSLPIEARDTRDLSIQVVHELDYVVVIRVLSFDAPVVPTCQDCLGVIVPMPPVIVLSVRSSPCRELSHILW